MDITFIQTSDHIFYYDMLNETSRTVRNYCIENNISYESYVGIKRGHMPWQSTYNRIYMLKEMLDRGVRGWVFYMDADSYVSDYNFDIRNYLSDKKHLAGIFAGFCYLDKGYDINAGGFAINLDHSIGRFIINEYWKRTEDIPDEVFNKADIWGKGIPEDQFLLFLVLQSAVENFGFDEVLLFEKSNESFVNHGPFIKQLLRSSSPDFKTRIGAIEAQVKSSLPSHTDTRAEYGPGYYFRMTHPAIRIGVGRRDLGIVKSFGKGGTLSYGPYIDLKKGNYLFRAFGEVIIHSSEDGRSIEWDVASDEGRKIWVSKSELFQKSSKGVLFSGNVCMDDDASKVELRIKIDENMDINLHAIQMICTDKWALD